MDARYQDTVGAQILNTLEYQMFRSLVFNAPKTRWPPFCQPLENQTPLENRTDHSNFKQTIQIPNMFSILAPPILSKSDLFSVRDGTGESRVKYMVKYRYVLGSFP